MIYFLYLYENIYVNFLPHIGLKYANSVNVHKKKYIAPNVTCTLYSFECPFSNGLLFA